MDHPEGRVVGQFLRYVHGFIGTLRASLDRLDPDEATRVGALVHRSDARLDTAAGLAAIADRA